MIIRLKSIQSHLWNAYINNVFAMLEKDIQDPTDCSVDME